MALYYKIPQPIEAVQFDGTLKTSKDINKLIKKGNRKDQVAFIFADKDEENVLLIGAESKVNLNKWTFVDEFGALQILEDQDFKAKYQPVDGGQSAGGQGVVNVK